MRNRSSLRGVLVSIVSCPRFVVFFLRRMHRGGHVYGLFDCGICVAKRCVIIQCDHVLCCSHLLGGPNRFLQRELPNYPERQLSARHNRRQTRRVLRIFLHRQRYLGHELLATNWDSTYHFVSLAIWTVRDTGFVALFVALFNYLRLAVLPGAKLRERKC